MDQHKMEVIKELMDELKGLMDPSADDLSERLGRPKPEVSIELEAEDPGMEEMGDDMMADDPEADFKKRLMKLRG